MADNINVGILEALIKTGYDPKGIAKFIDHLTTAKAKSVSAEKEVDRLKSAFNKLSASLDPVIAKEQKRQRQIDIATQSLNKGIISQEKYNKTLQQINSSLDQLDRNKALRNLGQLGSNLSSIGADLTKFITFPLIAIGAGSTKLAIDFESSFAGVRKTVDATEQEFAQLSRGLRDLAAGDDPIPIDVNKLNAIAESAGQLGIAKGDILEFTRTIAELGDTTNLTVDDAANSIAQFQNIFSAPGKEVDRFGSTLVALGNAGASTEKQILEMGLRIAGAGNQIGLTQGQVLAFASALSSVGIDAEAGGSAVSKVMIEMALAVERGGRELNNFSKVSGLTSEQFKTLFKSDAAQAVNTFITGLGKIKESGGSALKVLDDMGITETRMRDALLRSAGAGDLLTKSLELQSIAWNENNALAEEARKRYQTTESQITISINKIKDKAIDLGTSLLPIVKSILDTATPIVGLLGNIANSFSGMPPISQVAVVSFATLFAGIGPVLFISGQLVQSWATLISIAPKLGAAMTISSGAFGVIAAAIAAATLAATYWVIKWREASEEATRIAVQLGNLEGAALSFYKSIQANKGKITSTALSTAWEDADKLARKLIEAKDQLKQLKDQQNRPSNPLTESVSDESIKEAESNVKSLSSAYEKQKAGLRGIKEVIDVTAPAVSGLTGDIQLQTKAGDKLSETLADLERQYSNQVRLRQLASVGVAATNKEKDQQKAIETVLRIQNQLKSDGISLSQKQIDRIKFLVTGIEEEKRLEDAIIKAREKIGTLSIEYLDTVERTNEALKRADAYTFSQWEDSTAKALDYINKMIPRLDLVGKGLKNVFNPNISIDLLQKVADLVEDTATSEEKRAKAIAETIELMKVAVSLGVLNPQQAANVNANVARQNANPLYTPAQQEVKDFADGVIDSFRNINNDTREYVANIKRAVKEGFLSVSLGEEAIARVREQRMVDQIGGWQTLFSTLSNMFGGFGSKAISVIGQMISTWQAFQSAGNAIGGQAGSAIAGAGAFFAIVGAAVGLQSASIARSRQHQYDSSVHLGFNNDVDTAGRQGRALANALQSALDPILSLIGRTLENLPKIEIQARRDSQGFIVAVGSLLVGTFATLEDAVDAAVVAALEALGPTLPESIKTAIQNAGAFTSEDIQNAIQFAINYDNLGLSDIAIRIKELFKQVQFDVADATKYGLDGSKYLEKFKNDIQRIAYELIGVNTSTSDALQNLIDINNVLSQQTSILREQRENTLRALQEELGSLGSNPTDATNRRFQNPEEWERTRREVEEQIERIKQELQSLPSALSDVQINSTIFDQLYRYLESNKKYAEEAVKYAKIKVEIEFALIKARLEELGKWEQFAGMFTDAYNAAMNAAGRTGAGHVGGRGSINDTQSFIKDRSFQLDLNNMEEFARRRAEIEKEYQDKINELNSRDSKGRAELIALRDREIAQVAAEATKKTTSSYQDFINPSSGFDNIRKTADGLIKSIEDSPFGSARKAKMIANVLAEVNHQVEALSRQKAVSLFGEMLSDMQAFGATDEQMRDARMAMAILEHTIKMAHYKEEIESLKAQGKLAPEVIAKLEDTFKWLSGVDPTKFIGSNSGGGIGGGNNKEIRFKGYGNEITNTVNTLSDSLQRANDLLKKYKDDSLNPYQKDLAQFHEEWDTIFTSLGHGSEIMDQYYISLSKLNERYTSDLKDFKDDLNFDSFSGKTIDEQFSLTLSNWERLSGALSAGDLSKSGEFREQGQRALELLAKINGTTSTEFGNLRDRIEHQIDDVLGNSLYNGTYGGGNQQNDIANILNQGSQINSDILDAVNLQSSREVARLDDVVELLGQTVQLLQQPPLENTERVNFG